MSVLLLKAQAAAWRRNKGPHIYPCGTQGGRTVFLVERSLVYEVVCVSAHLNMAIFTAACYDNDYCQ